MRDQWDDVVATHTKCGIAKLVPARDGYVDHTIHHQDIRRALDRPRMIPDDRLTLALKGAVMASTPIFSPKKTARDLHLEATDIDWSRGTGADVRGPGEALLMAATGLAAALDDLDGEGVATLGERLAR